MPPKASRKSKESVRKPRGPKLEDIKTSREEMDESKMTLDETDGGEMSGDKYFGKYRIIDETELSFYCHATENGEVGTWLGGFKW